MTHNNRSVAENLRKTVRKLKDQLEAIHDHVVSDDSNKIKIGKIRKILEGEPQSSEIKQT